MTQGIVNAPAPVSSFKGVTTARALHGAPGHAPDRAWGLEALEGRVIELAGGSSSALLTVAAGLVHETQRRGMAAAWIGNPARLFYPPDFAASGIDLAALPVVCAPDLRKTLRAADTLLRSGGFALAVLDLEPGAELPLTAQNRLAGLAKQHRAAVLCLMRFGRNQSARGSLASLRAECALHRADAGRFTWELRVIKDKRANLNRRHTAPCYGPEGLC